MQAVDNYGGRDFWYKKVLSRPRKADNESEEQICWGREFQMEGEAKENDLQTFEQWSMKSIDQGPMINEIHRSGTNDQWNL